MKLRSPSKSLSHFCADLIFLRILEELRRRPDSYKEQDADVGLLEIASALLDGLPSSVRVRYLFGSVKAFSKICRGSLSNECVTFSEFILQMLRRS